MAKVHEQDHDEAAIWTNSFLHPACIMVRDNDKGNSTKDAGGGGGDTAKERTFTKVHPGSVSGKPMLEESLVMTKLAMIMSDLCSFVYKHGMKASKMTLNNSSNKLEGQCGNQHDWLGLT